MAKYAIYVIKGGAQSGPFTKRELMDMEDRGDVGPDDLMWFNKITDWLPIKEAMPDVIGWAKAQEEARQREEARLAANVARWPATEKQLAFLENLGVLVEEPISSMDASHLIDEALEKQNLVSEAQKRRLTFYGIPVQDGMTKLEATGLIDAYISEHPESEEKYQEWKAKNVGKDGSPLLSDDARAWAKNQSEEMKFELPERSADELPATPKQIKYIRSMLISIDEVGLAALGKNQASSLIVQIKREKERFACQKTKEWAEIQKTKSIQGRKKSSLNLTKIAVVIILSIALAIYFLAK